MGWIAKFALTGPLCLHVAAPYLARASGTAAGIDNILTQSDYGLDQQRNT